MAKVLDPKKKPSVIEASIPAAARVPQREKPIYFFDEGSADMLDLLGGKGAGLAEMTRAGLPVPDGFIITTQQCLAFYAAGRRFPDGLQPQVHGAMRELELRTGKRSSSTCVAFSSPVSLRIKPGDSELTAMPYSPSSRDSARVKASMAPLEVT